MKAYSTDLRQKIIEAHQRGQATQRTIAELFGVSVSFVEKLLQRYRTTGTLVAKPMAAGRSGDLTPPPTNASWHGYRRNPT